MIYIRKQIPYTISHPQATNSSMMEKLTIEIPTPNSKTFSVSNWYLPPENSHYIKRTGISLSELQPDIKVHEVTCADINAHDSAKDQTANPNARGEYLVNTAMDLSSTYLNDPEHPTRQRALSLLLTLRSSMLPFETDTIGNCLIPCRQTIVPSKSQSTFQQRS